MTGAADSANEGAGIAVRPIAVEGWRVLYEALDAANARWGPRLVGAYALGSLAHGGFSSAVSDVDLALILDRIDPCVGPAMAEVAANVRERLGTPLASRLSLFWSSWDELSLAEPQGRFPLVDRIDLVNAGRCLQGDDQRTKVALPVGEPRRRALLVEAAAFMLEKLAAEEKERLRSDPATLLAQGAREVTKAVLFPVRFLYTLGTNRVDGNAPAVRWYVAQSNSMAPRLATAALS